MNELRNDTVGEMLQRELSRRKVLAGLGGIFAVAVTGQGASAAAAPIKVSVRASKSGLITLVGSWSGLTEPATIWYSLQLWVDGVRDQSNQIAGTPVQTTSSRGRFTAVYQGTPGGGVYQYGGFVNPDPGGDMLTDPLTQPYDLGIPTFVSVK